MAWLTPGDGVGVILELRANECICVDNIDSKLWRPGSGSDGSISNLTTGWPVGSEFGGLGGMEVASGAVAGASGAADEAEADAVASATEEDGM